MIAMVLALLSSAQAQDSLGMRCVSARDYWQETRGLQIVGNLAYVCGGASGMHIINVADPVHPVEVGRVTWYQWDDLYADVAVAGNRAYLAFGADKGGYVYDIADPAHPAELGHWTMGGEGDMGPIYVYGTLGIVFWGGLPFVVDMSDPANVHQIGSFPNIHTDPGVSLGMIGSYLFLAGMGMKVWDLSDPTHPQRVAAADTTADTPFGTVSGNYAYLSEYEGAGIVIVDVSNPLQPVEVARCDSGLGRITVTGDHAVLTKPAGVDIWNVADPAHPVIESSCGTQSDMYVTGLTSSGNYVFAGLTQSDTSAVVIDISHPATPVVVSALGSTPGALRRMALSGNVAYVADSYVGFRTVDVSDPAHPTALGQVGRYYYGDVAVRGHYAYSTYCGGMITYDISNPALPESLSLDYGMCGARVLISGDDAYVIDDGNGGGICALYTFSLQDSAAPQRTDSTSILDVSVGFGVAISDGYLYLGAGLLDFDVYSLADPAHPRIAGYCHLPSQETGAMAVDVAVAGHYAYVADCSGGLRIIDVSDPAHPVEAGSCGGLVWAVAVSGNILCWDNGASSITVADISNPINPTEIGYYTTNEWLRDMKIVGPYLYTTSESQFRIYQVDALSSAKPHTSIPQEFALHPAYPNPFNPSTVISFSLPKTQHAKLTVYDVTGRQVQVPSDGVLSAGEHRVTFDGSTLSSGVYFARLEAGKNVRTQKMMLVK